MKMKYTVDWKQVKDMSGRHTAETKYEADGFVIWKGRYNVFSSIYSSNEWHLVRIADNKVLHSGITAKECKGALEYAIRCGKDIHTMDNTGTWHGVKFTEDFRPMF